MDQSSNRLVQLMLAATEIKQAFDRGLYLTDPIYYRALGAAYGQLAFEVFQETDAPLDWSYVLARSRCIDFTPDDVEFWLDDQAILVLCETLEREGYYACA